MPAEQLAYFVQFQRDHLVGSVLVVLPAAVDDAGELALRLARWQAQQPIPVALAVAAPDPQAGPPAAAGAGPTRPPERSAEGKARQP